MTETRQEQNLRIVKEEEKRFQELEREELEDLAKQNRELQKIIGDSRACRQFYNSDVGRFLLKRAIHDSEKAKDELANLDPANFTMKWAFEAEHQKLRNLAKTPQIIFAWVTEAIQAAVEADIISNEEDV